MGDIGDADREAARMGEEGSGEQHPRAEFMRMALELAEQSALVEHSGGPFGCVIVNQAGEVVGRGRNKVMTTHDPTCHGEVDAIRNACATLKTHILAGCVLYTSCEPCPMCYAACWWARIEAIYSGCSIHDTLEYGGFDDVPIYTAVSEPDMTKRALPGAVFLRDEMISLWERVRDDPGRVFY
mmetsp:Transcript_15558/g.41865  ORF Transcript_15558/g.41865 Transcript_15558/m.41865 type:complete len:183 (+) Transcript_15558:284-832(+)|eukprot:CAMPEP_0185832084 /NCGR_PEP_ID=MMETSP1353-20130828/1880_1 /TAXON_ID=1077150 /ORGANISM="Erythrolobus australicus, Strain CCMP3124" /LENGTH=182 /DNA_ID=CAMNT_0028530223 /DNA_START=278 /DNA_END=826 /DNA_ORIENTATION=-